MSDTVFSVVPAIASALNSVTIESSGTVGWAVKYDEPNKPFSDPTCQTNKTDRRGLRYDIWRAIASRDRKSTRLNSSHPSISYAVFCLKKKTNNNNSYNA